MKSTSYASREGKVSKPKSFRDYHMENRSEETRDSRSNRDNRANRENQSYRTRKPLNENSTALEKRRKDANKAKVGNHNRKKMAAKKQARGMV